MALPTIAIALGDPAGIGPEIAIKAALDPHVREICVPLLVGDVRTAELHARTCGIDVAFTLGHDREAPPLPTEGSIAFLHRDLLEGEPVRLGEIRARHGLAAVGAARTAIEAAMDGWVDAVVACPQTEFSIKQAGIEFDGYPTFVAKCTGTPVDDVFLMICFDDKRIVHVTLHVSLRRAIELVTAERVFHAIEVTAATLRHFGIGEPRLAVSGLNPHAGEHGMFGSEDAEVIVPAIARARARGLHIDGPIGADILFERRGYDAFVVMFHDQGHIAAKLLAPRRTAGLTIGTPILFSSVAHGSALDIAGQNKASPAAVIEAVQRLAHSAGNRTRAASPSSKLE
jgi:4-hydroxythreonine-4-phosphate dehydrogenase